MSDAKDDFFDRVNQSSGDAESIRTLVDRVTDLSEEILQAGFGSARLLTDADEGSLSFRLRDDEEGIAEYELFTVYTDGTVDFSFTLETTDYHRQFFSTDALETKPVRWCEARFDRVDEVEVSDLLDEENTFLDELAQSLEHFCMDVDAVLEREAEDTFDAGDGDDEIEFPGEEM